MYPIEFEGFNVIYAKDQPEYLPLPVHRSITGEVTSCWKLTWWERIYLLFTGKIYWMVLTFNSPLQPQMPSIKNPIKVIRG